MTGDLFGDGMVEGLVGLDKGILDGDGDGEVRIDEVGLKFMKEFEGLCLDFNWVILLLKRVF